MFNLRPTKEETKSGSTQRVRRCTQIHTLQMRVMKMITLVPKFMEEKNTITDAKIF